MRLSDTLHIPARKHVCNTVRAARRCVGCAKQIFDTIKHSQNTHNFLFPQFLDPLHIPTRKHICERVRAARRCVGCAKYIRYNASKHTRSSDTLHIPARKHVCNTVRAARRCVGCAKHTFDTRQYSQITATHCNTLQHTATHRFSDTLHIPARKHVCERVRAARAPRPLEKSKNHGSCARVKGRGGKTSIVLGPSYLYSSETHFQYSAL